MTDNDNAPTALTEHDDETLPPYNGPWVVCLYETNLAYGGPEEGGWWYHCGEPVMLEHMRGFNDRNAADAYLAELENSVVRELNDDGSNRTLSSVNCVGRYCAIICVGMPKPFPATVPHYE